jgi:hypothetical protein
MQAHRFGLPSAMILGLVLAVSGAARAAEPDEAIVNQVVELNKKALFLYGSLDVAGAAERLQEALALCQQADLTSHSVAARTHLHLGVVYVSGLKKREEGLAELKRALAIDPRIKIARSLENPEVKTAFAEAAAGPRPAPPPTAPDPHREHLAIHHPPVTQAIRGRTVAIKVQVPPGLGASKVVLAYQAQDADVFLAREMMPVAGVPGWFEAEIPSEATQGKSVAYYLEAQNPDDQPIANSATPEQPHQIALTPEVPPEECASPAPTTSPVEAPTSTAGPQLWLVLALGGGGGYHSGTPEMNRVDTETPPQDIHVSGVGLARLAHLAPEIGYFPRERLVLSVQARLQYVGGTQDVVLEQRTYRPARLALAGLGKLTWFPRRGEHTLRPFFNIEAGAGQIRHNVTTPASAALTGCGNGSTCKDTVVGGLVLMGAGAGTLWMLDRGLAAYGAVNVLVGVPNAMVNADLNVGIAVLR